MSNPEHHQVHLRGGVVAGSLTAQPSQLADPSTTVGFANLVVLQRTVEITSSLGGDACSTMTVQINESGSYAVNSWVVS